MSKQTVIAPRTKRSKKADHYYSRNIWLNLKQTTIASRTKGDKRRKKVTPIDVYHMVNNHPD